LLSLLLAIFLILFAIRQMREARAFTEKMQQTQKLEALGQLTGGLAHDFNNLLTPVIGTLDQLSRRESLDPKGRRLAAGALTSAQRAAKLTSQLLAFSRRQKLSVAPISVQRLVRDVGELIERSLGARHPFKAHVDPAVLCVASDGNQLEVALLNLALNARDASPEGSPISLQVRPDGAGHVLFEFSDRGVGMDEKTQSRALEPFFTTKPLGQGTGLGLAQVFGVVAQSGGTMTINSRLGEGTKITLSLPACEEEEAAEVATSISSPAPQMLRLLVVDDDAAVRATIAGILMEDGHSVEAVASGASALTLLQENEYDLVVVDFLMPGMTGTELIKAVGEFREGVRFLLVSGYADSNEIANAREHADLLRKPFTPDELRRAMATASLAPRTAN
jgi:CheY-like chemotaxis protein/nitrogen-specific signal transduction histidine kinase